MTWKDITYKQLVALRDAIDIQDEEDRLITLAQIIFGEDVIELPINEFKKKCLELSFLQEEMPNDLTVKEVKVNGREYYFDGLLGRITTAQYIDFQNYLKTKDEARSFSVFFIPKGHKYNDGYDMQQVFNDIMDVPAPILISASFFFTKQLETFIRIFQRYLIKKLKKQMRKTTLTKEMKKNLIQIAESQNSLASYLMSSNFVKRH